MKLNLQLLKGIAIGIALAGLAYPYIARAQSVPQVKDVAPVQVVASKPVWLDTATKEEIVSLIKKYSSEFSISEQLTLKVAYCESGYNYLSKNKNSSASGVYQWIKSSWANTPEGKAGYSVFNAEANVKAGVRSIAQGGIENWNASKSCWQNYKSN